MKLAANTVCLSAVDAELSITNRMSRSGLARNRLVTVVVLSVTGWSQAEIVKYPKIMTVMQLRIGASIRCIGVATRSNPSRGQLTPAIANRVGSDAPREDSRNPGDVVVMSRAGRI